MRTFGQFVGILVLIGVVGAYFWWIVALAAVCWPQLDGPEGVSWDRGRGDGRGSSSGSVDTACRPTARLGDGRRSPGDVRALPAREQLTERTIIGAKGTHKRG
jgi:hypothetical protein